MSYTLNMTLDPKHTLSNHAIMQMLLVLVPAELHVLASSQPCDDLPDCFSTILAGYQVIRRNCSVLPAVAAAENGPAAFNPECGRYVQSRKPWTHLSAAAEHPASNADHQNRVNSCMQECRQHSSCAQPVSCSGAASALAAGFSM